MRLHLSFIRRRFEFVIRTGSFSNVFKSGALLKRYGFIGRVNCETASISKRSGAKLAGSQSVVLDAVSRSWKPRPYERILNFLECT